MRLAGAGGVRLGPMFAAPIWHWWLGLVMLLAAGGATLSLVAGYLKMVTSQRYPNGRRGKEQEL